jgi:hypothetical protein
MNKQLLSALALIILPIMASESAEVPHAIKLLLTHLKEVRPVRQTNFEEGEKYGFNGNRIPVIMDGMGIPGKEVGCVLAHARPSILDGLATNVMAVPENHLYLEYAHDGRKKTLIKSPQLDTAIVACCFYIQQQRFVMSPKIAIAWQEPQQVKECKVYITQADPAHVFHAQPINLMSNKVEFHCS